MNSAVVAALAQILDDYGNQRVDSDTAKNRLAAVLSGKHATEVLRELDAYIRNLPGKERGKPVLIVMMALLRLDLDSGPALAGEIRARGYKLAGPLYGGLAMLLKGKSSNFTFQLSALRREAKNLYGEIERWNDHFFWPHIELFLAAKLLRDLDQPRFERLTREDPNGILLLSMAQGHLSVAPSEDLLKSLLESQDPLHPHFALAFYTQPVSILCDRVRQKAAKRGDIKKLNEYVDRYLEALEVCTPGLRAELLTNYLLIHCRVFPVAFARQLVGSELQAEFAVQITEPGKVRTIQELGFLAYLIEKTPACDGQKHRISKRPLADAVLDVLIHFVRERTGIYTGDGRWQKDVEAVLHLLTSRQRRRFERFLVSQDRPLMISPLDKLVRFELYLADTHEHQIIQGLQECLDRFP